MARRITPYVEEVDLEPTSSFNSEVYLEESPLDAFIREEVIIDDVTSVTLTSDITMLFNQERLDKLSQIALVQKFDSMSKATDALNQVRSKMTDEQLVQFIKSRYIQSPSELISWTNYLAANYESVSAEMQAIIDLQKQKDVVTSASDAAQSDSIQA